MRSAPGFVTSNPPPAEWQERIQRLDEDLWIAWNPVDPNGPRWGIVRHHGRVPKDHGVVLIDPIDHESELVSACMHGWSYLGPLQDRDGNPCGLTDTIVEALYKNDWARRYGKTPEEAAEKFAAETKALADERQAKHDAAMADAFADTKKDHVLNNARTHGVPAAGV